MTLIVMAHVFVEVSALALIVLTEGHDGVLLLLFLASVVTGAIRNRKEQANEPEQAEALQHKNNIKMDFSNMNNAPAPEVNPEAVQANEKKADEVAYEHIVGHHKVNLEETLDALKKDLYNRGITQVTPQALSCIIFGMDTLMTSVMHSARGQGMTDEQLQSILHGVPVHGHMTMHALRKHVTEKYKVTTKPIPTLPKPQNEAPEGS